MGTVVVRRVEADEACERRNGMVEGVGESRVGVEVESNWGVEGAGWIARSEKVFRWMCAREMMELSSCGRGVMLRWDG